MIVDYNHGTIENDDCDEMISLDCESSNADMDEVLEVLSEAKDLLSMVAEAEGNVHGDDVIEIKRFLERNKI